MQAISTERSYQEAPVAWRVVLRGVKIGRGAVAGAAVALALVGAAAVIESVATTAMVTVPVVAFGAEVLNIAATIGAVIGAGFQAIFNN
jgi:hypothetical protein